MVNYSAVATVTWDDTDGRGQEGCVQRLAQISEPEQVNDKVEDGPKPTPPQPGIKLHNKRQESITGRVKRTDDAVLVVFWVFFSSSFFFCKPERANSKHITWEIKISTVSDSSDWISPARYWQPFKMYASVHSDLWRWGVVQHDYSTSSGWEGRLWREGREILS